MGLRWIDAKTRIYQAHSHCEAVIVVEQHRREVRLSRRSGAMWHTAVLSRPEDDLVVPACGTRCRVGDLYRGMPLPARLRAD